MMHIYIEPLEDCFEYYQKNGAYVVDPDPRILKTQKIIETLFDSRIVNTKEVPETEGRYHAYELAVPVPSGVEPIEFAIFVERALTALTDHDLHFSVDYEYD